MSQVEQADYLRLLGKHGQHAPLGCFPLTLVRRMATIGLPHLQTCLQNITHNLSGKHDLECGDSKSSYIFFDSGGVRTNDLLADSLGHCSLVHQKVVWAFFIFFASMSSVSFCNAWSRGTGFYPWGSSSTDTFLSATQSDVSPWAASVPS